MPNDLDADFVSRRPKLETGDRELVQGYNWSSFRPPEPSAYLGYGGGEFGSEGFDLATDSEGVGGNARASRALRGALGKETPPRDCLPGLCPFPEKGF
jgi:hypothetical protein